MGRIFRKLQIIYRSNSILLNVVSFIPLYIQRVKIYLQFNIPAE